MFNLPQSKVTKMMDKTVVIDIQANKNVIQDVEVADVTSLGKRLNENKVGQESYDLCC